MRIDALEDQETGFQCGDADDNDEGRYILFYFFFRTQVTGNNVIFAK